MQLSILYREAEWQRLIFVDDTSLVDSIKRPGIPAMSAFINFISPWRQQHKHIKAEKNEHNT